MNAFIFFPKATRAWRALRAGLVVGKLLHFTVSPFENNNLAAFKCPEVV